MGNNERTFLDSYQSSSKQAIPKPTYIRYSTLDHEYGKCTKDGWVR